MNIRFNLQKIVILPVGIALLWPGVLWGELTVKVSPPKFVGSKADIKLEMLNTFPQKIESARAVVFLVDEKARFWAKRHAG